MLKYLTYEKIEEIIGLADEAGQELEAAPGRWSCPAAERDQCSDVMTRPLAPQLAASWKQALPRFLADLSEKALGELAAIYDKAGPEWGDSELLPKSHERLAVWLAARTDLADRLTKAL